LSPGSQGVACFGPYGANRNVIRSQRLIITFPLAGTYLGRPRKQPTAAVNGQPRGRKSARTLALTELEADIDRLIFKVMGVGDLTEIEESLRQARRLLYVTANGR
jgi:hypothetical protein